mgnify:FL=1
MNIRICETIGFCAGVRRALAMTDELLKRHGAPVCILHDLVHNERVVEDLRARGVVIVETPDGLPENALLVFSAHGVSEAAEAHARSLPLRIVDATCPLVHRVHKRAAALSEQGFFILLFGKGGHREVEGILGRIPGEKALLENLRDAETFLPREGTRYACLSQTTFNQATVDEMVRVLRRRIPDLRNEASVCEATRERQLAVRRLARECDLVFVAGSAHSSNTRRLCEIAEEEGAKTILAASPEDVDPAALAHAESVGIASGASAPDDLVAGIAERVKRIASELERTRAANQSGKAAE